MTERTIMKIIKNLLTIINLINVLMQAIAYARNYMAMFAKPVDNLDEECLESGYPEELTSRPFDFCYDGGASDTTRVAALLRDHLKTRTVHIMPVYKGSSEWSIILELSTAMEPIKYRLNAGSLITFHPGYINLGLYNEASGAIDHWVISKIDPE